MSRTYKDRPYWVRQNDPREDRVPYHDHIERWWRRRINWDGECHLDEPVNHETRHSFPCGYYLRQRWYNVPRDFRHYNYYGPLRAHERDNLRDAAKQYNSWGEVDEDFYLPEAHRHATFGGGYWD